MEGLRRGQLNQDSELFHWCLPLRLTHGSATGVPDSAEQLLFLDVFSPQPLTHRQSLLVEMASIEWGLIPAGLVDWIRADNRKWSSQRLA